MTRVVILDPEPSARLEGLREAAELCDAAGRVLGWFVPSEDAAQWEPVGPEVTEEELDRREQSTEWHTTSEVLAHLKGLGGN